MPARYVTRALNVQARLNAAPLRAEREEFLLHLKEQGTTERQLQILATRIVEINRVLAMTSMRKIDTSELDDAIDQEKQRRLVHARHKWTDSSAYVLRNTAKNWLRFNRCLSVEEAKPESPFGGVLEDFLGYVQATRGARSPSLRNLKAKLSFFMHWAASHRCRLQDVTLLDIDKWLQMKRAEGMQPRSIAAYCWSLRSFYRWANLEGWTEQKIASGIKSPRIPSADRTPKGPSWADVRRLTDSISGKSRSAIRLKAIILLCAVYGLRNVEIRQLSLDDLNWESSVMTIRRAKRGQLHKFPIQAEVGDAIIDYLQHARPKSSSRILFLTIRSPFRPLHGSSLPGMIRERLELLKIESQYRGPHALRHACATELLHQGSCLTEIAAFLGHKSLSSVSIYAKLDERSLRLVADFSLQGVL